MEGSMSSRDSIFSSARMGRPAATRPMSGRPSCSRMVSMSLMPREAPGTSAMTPLRESAQVFFSGVGRFEAKLVGDFRPRGGHAGFVNGALDEAQDFGLARGEVGHGGFL